MSAADFDEDGTGSPVLSLRGVSKRYQNAGPLVLDDLNIDLHGGEIVALIGASGAGKSTLLRCVNRLVEPTTGDILVAGENIVRLSRSRLRKARRGIGMVFQEYALVERLSVMENVLSGRLGYVTFWKSFLRRFPEDDIATALSLLKRVGLDGFAHKRADALSGGQRQRVGIARALAQQPRLLLVDEPTASLDPRSARQIMRLIRDICRERRLTALINIHDVRLGRQFADRVLGLKGGRIVFDGAPALLTDEMLTTVYGEEDWKPLDRDRGTYDDPVDKPAVEAVEP